MTRWTDRRRDGRLHFDVQTEMLGTLFSRGEMPALSELISLMRHHGEASIYFSGRRQDHRYCLSSDELGLALSVLPEDACKAAEPGFHPGSTEVYCVIEGALSIDTLHRGGAVVNKSLTRGEILVIPPGRCHRVKRAGESDAASLIVKTNLWAEPPVVRCDNCSYYATPSGCSLHQSWQAEQS